MYIRRRFQEYYWKKKIRKLEICERVPRKGVRMKRYGVTDPVSLSTPTDEDIRYTLALENELRLRHLYIDDEGNTLYTVHTV